MAEKNKKRQQTDDELLADTWQVDDDGGDPIVADWTVSDDDDDDDGDNNDEEFLSGDSIDNVAVVKELQTLKRKDKFAKLKQIKKQKASDETKRIETTKTPLEMHEEFLSHWPTIIGDEEKSTEKLKVEHFYGANSIETATCKNGCSFVSAIAIAMPSYKKKLVAAATTTSEEDRGSPVVLVICASAHRSTDIINSISQGLKCKIAKLFAKHFKVEEQVDVLSKQTFPVAVGTPNRLAKLVELGALSLSRTQLILVDDFVDEKKLTILTMPIVRDDFYNFLYKYVLSELSHIKLTLVKGSLRLTSATVNNDQTTAEAQKSNSSSSATPSTSKPNKNQKKIPTGTSRFKKAKFAGSTKRKGF